jgi:hypothetical protein
MTVVRAELARQLYFGDDAVLLVMDTDGATTFLSALVRAQRQGASRLEGDGTVHDFLIEPDAADIELHDDRVGVATRSCQGQRDHRVVDGDDAEHH